MAEFFTQAQISVDQLAQIIFNDVKPILEKEAANIAYTGGYGSGTKGIRNLRGALSALTPVLVLIDIEDAKKELLKFLSIESKKDSFEIIGSEKTAIVKNVEAKKVKAVIQNKKSNTLEVIDEIIASIEKGIEEFRNKAKPEKKSFQVLGTELNIQNYAQKRAWKSGKIFELQGNIGRNVKYAFVFSDYDTASTTLQIYLIKNLKKYLESVGKSKSIEKLNAFLDLGHSVARLGLPDNEDEYYGNFPKLSGIIIQKVLDAGLSTSESIQLPSIETAPIIEDFLKYTGQLSNSITVTKEFTEGFLKTFVSYGGQVLKLENSIINRYRGSVFERAAGGQLSPEILNQLNALLATKLKLYYSAINNSTQLKEVIKNNINKLIPGAISSPSIISYIEDTLVSILKTGKGIPKFSSNKRYSNKSTGTPTSKTTKSVQKLKGKKLKVPAVKVQQITKPKNEGFNLLNLQNLINTSITAQIRFNMGTGYSKDVLNYRTGRFAQSVKVERLSESRAGMITAFYSYMKNPYATFSEGGRQEIPKSRDPKLLISKSIREIAATLVTNRLRAVST